MAYIPSTFVDRSVEFPGRRVLTPVSGQADTFDVTRAEGTEFAVGTKPDAANLNAEFQKIKTETDAINTNLNAQIASKKLLWTNPNPTTAFAGQTLTINFTPYNFIELICTYGSTGGEEVFTLPSITMPKGKGAYFRVDDSSGTVKLYRNVESTSNAGIVIGSSNNNSYIIPYKIIGHIIN